jgi:hypothetical protein
VYDRIPHDRSLVTDALVVKRDGALPAASAAAHSGSFRYKELQYDEDDFQYQTVSINSTLLGSPYRLRHPDAAASRTSCNSVDDHEPGPENLLYTTRAVPGRDVRRPERRRGGPMNASPDCFELTFVKPATSARSAFVDFDGADPLDLKVRLTIGAFHRGPAKSASPNLSKSCEA